MLPSAFRQRDNHVAVADVLRLPSQLSIQTTPLLHGRCVATWVLANASTITLQWPNTKSHILPAHAGL